MASGVGEGGMMVLWYCKEWEAEDNKMAATARTQKAVGDSMKNITECLAFTMESGEDFCDNWLPTLDRAQRNPVLFL